MLKKLFLLTLIFLSGCSVEYSEDVLLKAYKNSLAIESAYVEGILDIGALLSVSFQTSWRYNDAAREQYLTARIASQNYAIYENQDQIYIFQSEWLTGKDAVDVLLAQSYLITLVDIVRPVYFLESLLDLTYSQQQEDGYLITFLPPQEHLERILSPFMPPEDPVLRDTVYHLYIEKDYTISKIEIAYNIVLPGTTDIPVQFNWEYHNINQTMVSIPQSLKDVLESP